MQGVWDGMDGCFKQGGLCWHIDALAKADIRRENGIINPPAAADFGLFAVSASECRAVCLGFHIEWFRMGWLDD